MTTRNSINLDYKAVTAEQKEAALNYVRQARPTTFITMDGPGFAKQVHDAGGGATVSIYRRYGPPERGWDEGSLWRTKSPETYARYATEDFTVSREVWIHVLNEPYAEPHEIQALGRWLIAVGELLIARGYRFVGPNLGPATVQPWHLEQGLWDEVIRKFSAWSHHRDSQGNWHPLAFFAIHEYTGIFLPYGVGYVGTNDLVNRDVVQPQRWPKTAPVQYVAPHTVDGRQTRYPPYWHINRGPAWFQLRAAEIGVPAMYLVITEFGLDRMPDMTLGMPNIYEVLAGRYGTNGHSVLRGPDSYAGVWKYYWPDWSFAEALHQQTVWVNGIYNEYVIGWMWFQWSHADDWDRQYGFNLAKHPAYWQRSMQQPSRPPLLVAPQPKIPPVTTLQNPLPPDSERWVKGVAEPKSNDFVNIRYAPNTSNNTPFARLSGAHEVRVAYIDNSAWAYIELNGQQGYIYMPLVRFIPAPPEEEPAVTPYKAIVKSTSAILLRAQPGGTIIRSVRDGEVVEVYPTVREVNGMKWREVRHGLTFGWMALVWPTWADQFRPVPKPDNSKFWLLYPVGFEATITGRMNDKRNYGKHEGLDLAPLVAHLEDYPVFAARDGVVDKVAYNATGYGWYVRIRHTPIDGAEWVTWYAHLEAGSIRVKEGDQVMTGAVIGKAGNSGNSTGRHLHLTLQKIPGGQSGYVVENVVDPLPYIYHAVPEGYVLGEHLPTPPEPEPPTPPEPSAEMLKLIEVTENLGKAMEHFAEASEMLNAAAVRLQNAMLAVGTTLRDAQEYLDVLEELSEKLD